MAGLAGQMRAQGPPFRTAAGADDAAGPTMIARRRSDDFTMFTPEQIDRIRASFKHVAPHADDLTRLFFTRLFTAGPSVRALFPRDAAARSQDLIASLGIVVKNLSRLDSIEHLLTEMGIRHHRAGVQPQHYGIVRDAMIASMRDVAQGEGGWDARVEQDWQEVFNVVASMMIRGAGQARRLAA